jgi:hypothetical protein
VQGFVVVGDVWHLIDHVLDVAAGATRISVWSAFPAQLEGRGSPTVDLIGSVVCGLVAVVLLPARAR